MINEGTLIWVEGVISSGKSTFSREIGKRLNLRLIEEPVSKAESKVDNPYLEKFYKDPAKYGFPMQIFLLHQRYAMQQLASYECTGVGGYSGAILDRSIAGDRVFAKMLMQNKYIDPLDYETYLTAYNIMCRSLLPPTLFIYLDVQPETAFNRMHKRNRSAENGVSLEYLKQLRTGYQELIKEAEQCLLPWSHAIKVCRIPFDLEIIDDKQWDAMALTIQDACHNIK